MKSTTHLTRFTASPPLIFVIFILWALVLTYPLPFYLFSHIPLGDEKVGTVPFFNLWTLQWNIDQLLQGYPSYWDAPIFAPLNGTFAFSEPQPLSALLAAPFWLGLQSAAVGYNALVILFLTLNGWFTYWLLKHWGVSSTAALLTGLMMQTLPFVAQEMGVLQLIALFGFLWSLLFMSRFLSYSSHLPGRLQTGLCLAIGPPVTFFTCGYYGLFSLLFLPLALVCQLQARHLKPQTISQLLLIGLVSLALSAPFLWAQQHQLNQHGFVRSPQTIENNSARPAYYINFLDYNLLYGRFLGLKSAQGQRLSPGLGLTLLAGVGLFGRTQKRLKLYLSLGIILAVVLSLGLRLRFGDFQPYEWLRVYVPGFAQLRSPFRFAMLAQLHLALLAGFGLQNLSDWLSKEKLHKVAGVEASAGGGQTIPLDRLKPRLQPDEGRLAQVRRLSLLGVTLIILVESLALPLPLQAMPTFNTNAPWQAWLNQQNQPPQVVLLPFAASNAVADFEQTTLWMLESRYFRGQMLNGYSGFFPPSHVELRQQMLQFPTGEAIDFLCKLQVNYLIVYQNLPNAPQDTEVQKYLPLVYQDQINRVAIYKLPE